MAHPAHVPAGAAHRGVWLLDGTGCKGQAVLSLPVFTLRCGLSAQQRASLCPGPRLVALLESRSWGGFSSPVLSSPGRCSHTVGTGERQELLWLKPGAAVPSQHKLGSCACISISRQKCENVAARQRDFPQCLGRDPVSLSFHLRR